MKTNWTLHDLEMSNAYARGHFDGITEGLNMMKLSSIIARDGTLLDEHGRDILDEHGRAIVIPKRQRAYYDIGYRPHETPDAND
jgi:hypothetical protein